MGRRHYTYGPTMRPAALLEIGENGIPGVHISDDRETARKSCDGYC